MSKDVGKVLGDLAGEAIEGAEEGGLAGAVLATAAQVAGNLQREFKQTQNTEADRPRVNVEVVRFSKFIRKAIRNARSDERKRAVDGLTRVLSRAGYVPVDVMPSRNKGNKFTKRTILGLLKIMNGEAPSPDFVGHLRNIGLHDLPAIFSDLATVEGDTLGETERLRFVHKDVLTGIVDNASRINIDDPTPPSKPKGDGGEASETSRPPETKSKVPKLDPPPEDEIDDSDLKTSDFPESKATDPPNRSPIAEENLDPSNIRISPPSEFPDGDSDGEFTYESSTDDEKAEVINRLLSTSDRDSHSQADIARLIRNRLVARGTPMSRVREIVRGFRGDIPRLIRDGLISIGGGLVAGAALRGGTGTDDGVGAGTRTGGLNPVDTPTEDPPFIGDPPTDSPKPPTSRFRERKVETPSVPVQAPVQHKDIPTLRPEFKVGDAEEELGQTPRERQVAFDNYVQFGKDKFKIQDELVGGTADDLAKLSASSGSVPETNSGVDPSPLTTPTPQPAIRSNNYYRKKQRDVGNSFYLPMSEKGYSRTIFSRQQSSSKQVKVNRLSTIRVIPDQVGKRSFQDARVKNYQARFRSTKAY